MKVGDNRFLFRSSAFMFNFAPHAKTGLKKKEADTRRSPQLLYSSDHFPGEKSHENTWLPTR